MDINKLGGAREKAVLGAIDESHERELELKNREPRWVRDCRRIGLDPQIVHEWCEDFHKTRVPTYESTGIEDDFNIYWRLKSDVEKLIKKELEKQ